LERHHGTFGKIRGQHTIRACAAAARKLPQPLELQGVKILPARATDPDSRPIHCAAVHLVRITHKQLTASSLQQACSSAVVIWESTLGRAQHAAARRLPRAYDGLSCRRTG
jgi:hypothetical protein